MGNLITPADAVAIPRHWSSTFLNNDALSSVQTYLFTDKSFVTHFTPKIGVEGPKAHSHGGFLATILDETMGSACWYNGLPVLAANLSVRYRKSVPLGDSYICEARIDRLETRRAMVAARIYKDDTTFCEATGVFVRVPIELLKQQPDMVRMVEVVESIKAGGSIHELIERDRARRAMSEKHAADLQNIIDRGQKIAGETLALAADFFKTITRN
ncbi:MAG: PaaI family thioesterase [Turneriella sp.]